MGHTLNHCIVLPASQGPLERMLFLPSLASFQAKQESPVYIPPSSDPWTSPGNRVEPALQSEHSPPARLQPEGKTIEKKQTKKERKLEQNRQAAKRFRERRRWLKRDLEEKEKELMAEKQYLHEAYQIANTQNEVLKEQLEYMNSILHFIPSSQVQHRTKAHPPREWGASLRKSRTSYHLGGGLRYQQASPSLAVPPMKKISSEQGGSFQTPLYTEELDGT